MDLALKILLALQVLSALGMVGLILLQHGKGADMGATFGGGGGGGGSGSLFGAAGGANFLSRSTAVLATIFFAATLGLAYLSSAGHGRPAESRSVLESVPATPTAPSPNSSIVQQIPGAAPATSDAAKNAVPAPVNTPAPAK